MEIGELKDILPNMLQFSGFDGIFQAIFEFILEIAGILVVIAIIYSGIRYIMAGADANAAAVAKKNLTWAIIGLVIILLAITITYWIGLAANGDLDKEEKINKEEQWVLMTH